MKWPTYSSGAPRPNYSPNPKYFLSFPIQKNANTLGGVFADFADSIQAQEQGTTLKALSDYSPGASTTSPAPAAPRITAPKSQNKLSISGVVQDLGLGPGQQQQQEDSGILSPRKKKLFSGGMAANDLFNSGVV